jgi:hypothetical protein
MSREEIIDGDKLGELLNGYIAEMEKCGRAGAYFAGCVMAASALEAVLLAKVNLEFLNDEKRKLSKFKRKKSLVRLTLGELIETAREVGWFPFAPDEEIERNLRKAKIGNLMEVVREIRNMLHPGKWLKDYPDIKHINKEHFEASYSILKGAIDHLYNQLITELRKK